MTDMSPRGLPKSPGRGKSRDAEELTVDVEEGFDPFAGLPDDPADETAEAGAEAATPLPRSEAETGYAAGGNLPPPSGPERGNRPDARRRATAGAVSDAEGALDSVASASWSGADAEHAVIEPGEGRTTPEGAGGPARPLSPSPADIAAAAQLLGVPAALARLDVTLTVEVGRRRLPLAELVRGDAGTVIPLDRLVDEPVDILVNGMPFARGEIVAVGEQFAVRLLSLVEPAP